MIVSNPGVRGSAFADANVPEVFNGVPTRALEILPSTLNWTEVINVLP